MVKATPTLKQVAERQVRLRAAGAIVCVGFIFALLFGLQSVANTSHQNAKLTSQNSMLIARITVDEHQLKIALDRTQSLAISARIVSCEDTNGVKDGALRYIASLTTRSLAANQATIASPTATDRQKLVARISIASVQANLGQARIAFADKDCTKIGTK